MGEELLSQTLPDLNTSEATVIVRKDFNALRLSDNLGGLAGGSSAPASPAGHQREYVSLLVKVLGISQTARVSEGPWSTNSTLVKTY